MLFSVDGKVALVTGGSRGIGKMIATGFVNAGARVYIASRNLDACSEVAADLSKFGECIPLAADLSTEAGCQALGAMIKDREVVLDILVNNAGALSWAPLEEFDDAAFERTLAINVKAVFQLTRSLLPLIRAAGTAEVPARVINIGSIDGLSVPPIESYSYSTSKAAVHMLTRHLAKQLAPAITVNAIAPGPFESQMLQATLAAFGDAIVTRAPLQRIGRPDDVAGTAIFLASRAGAYLTGAVIPVDGGISTLA